jgi:hypothetical protein
MTPPRFAPSPFTPGRYTNALARTTRATHARQQVREALTSSFTLELHPDGAATLCRSWRYLATNRGPAVQTEERIREQLGYRGHWRSAGDGVEVTLDRDDTVCPPVGEYLELVPHHDDHWELVCHPVTALEAPGLEAPMLLCASPFEAPRFGEDEPHLVGGVRVEGGTAREGGATPRGWIVLGAGEGVRIEVERSSVEPAGEERVRMRPGGGEPTSPWDPRPG